MANRGNRTGKRMQAKAERERSLFFQWLDREVRISMARWVDSWVLYGKEAPRG